MRTFLGPVVCVVGLFLACNGSGDASRDVRGDAADEADAVEAMVTEVVDATEIARDALPDPGLADTGPDPARSCTDGPLSMAPFALLPGEPLTQIHAALDFDGAAVWVAYNVPDPLSNDFDVRVARLWCDGIYATPPAIAHVTALGNDTDPDLAVGPSSVMVVWAGDTHEFPANFVTYARGYHLDGSPVADGEVRLDLVVDGAPVAASAWLAKVAALPDGTFALVGSWADPSATRWQVFLAHLGADGGLVPPLGGSQPGVVRLAPAPDADQTNPDVTARADGSLVVAWTSSLTETDSAVTWVTVGTDGIVSAPRTVANGNTDGVALAAGGTDASAFAAWFRPDAPTTIGVERLGDDAAASFGEGVRRNHSPVVAPFGAGGALAWYRTRSGYQVDYMVQGFHYDSGAITPVGQALALNGDQGGVSHAALGVYGPALTHVRDHVYLAAWSEGDSPDLSVVGLFVEVP